MIFIFIFVSVVVLLTVTDKYGEIPDFIKLIMAGLVTLVFYGIERLMG